MKISKTKFMYFSKNPHLEKFMTDYARIKDEQTEVQADDLFRLHEMEKQAKLRILFKESIRLVEEDEERDFELTDLPDQEDDPYMEAMLQYYTEVELLSARKVKEEFGGNVISSDETYEQKYFEREIDGYKFFSFLDTYQEDDKMIRIIETKATTSSKFHKLGYSVKKVFYPIFTKLPSGVMVLKEEVEDPATLDIKYYQHRNKLFDKNSDVGKYIFDIAYQRFIIDNQIKSGENKLRKYYLAILNHEYVFDGRYDEHGKAIFSNDIIVFLDVSTITQEYLEKMEEEFNQVIFKLDHMDENLIKLDEILMLNDSWDKIKYEELVGLDNPITDFPHNHHGFKRGVERIHIKDLIEDGILEVPEIPTDLLDNNKKKIIYNAVVDQKLYTDDQNIKTYLDTYNYPLYHLDFETFNGPLPRYKGETPYTQSVYQFSIHIEHAPGVCDKDKDHIEYLAGDHQDHRRQIAEALIKHIKQDGGDIIAYNYGFEKSVMKKLASYFPDLSNDLYKLIDRTKDLLHILRNQKQIAESLGLPNGDYNYYHPNQHGSFSIKKILPTLSDLSYDNLAVQNGNEALVSYVKLPKLYEEDKEAYKEEYNNMLEYCKQDTWAMVLILKELRKIVNY